MKEERERERGREGIRCKHNSMPTFTALSLTVDLQSSIAIDGQVGLEDGGDSGDIVPRGKISKSITEKVR